MKKIFYFLCSVLLFLFFACEKAEKPIVLPPPGALTKGVANIGPNYDDQVYVNLTTGENVTRTLKNYDLAFEASANGFHIYLNTGKLMYACRSGNIDITSADSTGKAWYSDNDHLDDDSTAITNTWHNSGTASEVFIIDRGKLIYPTNPVERLRKLLVKEVNETSYQIQYSKYNNSELNSFTILKDSSYSLMYFSFDNGGQVVQMAPPKDNWDIVFTRFTHTFYDYPLGAPEHYYLVNGGLINRWTGVTGTMIKDSLPNYIPFADFNYSNVANYNFVNHADAIGYDWKVYDFNSSSYLIIPNKFYVIKNAQGLYFKIRFIDFYDPLTGNKGFITYDYQRL